MSWAALQLMYAARYTSTAIPSVALRHCLLPYLFGVAVLATSINLVVRVISH